MENATPREQALANHKISSKYASSVGVRANDVTEHRQQIGEFESNKSSAHFPVETARAGTQQNTHRKYVSEIEEPSRVDGIGLNDPE